MLNLDSKQIVRPFAVHSLESFSILSHVTCEVLILIVPVPNEQSFEFSKHNNYNKIAFQEDAYRPLVARISQHALRWGGPASSSQGGLVLGMPASGLGIVYSWRGCAPLVLAGACLWSQGRVPASGHGGRGVCSGGGLCLWYQEGVDCSGGCISACNGTGPPVNRMTDRCKKYYLAPNFFCRR